MVIEPKLPVTVYLIYAQRDEALKQEFDDYLVILQDTGLITSRVERQIQQGTDWSKTIDPRLLVSDLILLLMSPSLLASGYCSGAEFYEAFERNKPPRKAALVPILLHHVELTGYPLETIASLPRRQPVSLWSQRHEAWRSVDQEIRWLILHGLRLARRKEGEPD